MAITAHGLLVLQCGGAQNFTLRLVDPVTLKDLATYNLPPRPSTLQAAESANLDKVYSDSSGAYFYLDNRDRVVVADAAQHPQRIRIVQAQDGSWSFVRSDDWDLSTRLPHDCTTYTNPLPQGSCDPITGVLPDWHGLLWWITRYGRVGTLDPATGHVHIRLLSGEEIENSHAVSEDGVAVVSDHAMYLFRASSSGAPSVVWRAPYDRGTARKVGQINQGSGTTPTFLGRNFVAITDNADARMHVLVYRRAARRPHGQSRLFCSVPVFGTGRGATENSLVGWGDGLVVENNFGYLNPTTRLSGGTQPGGVTKVVVGKHGCRVAWTGWTVSPSVVPKLARGNGKLLRLLAAPATAGHRRAGDSRRSTGRPGAPSPRSRPGAARRTTTPGRRSPSARTAARTSPASAACSPSATPNVDCDVRCLIRAVLDTKRRSQRGCQGGPPPGRRSCARRRGSDSSPRRLYRRSRRARRSRRRRSPCSSGSPPPRRGCP